MTQNITTRFYSLLLSGCFLLLLSGCKKETVHTAYPYNAIEQFVLADAKGDALHALIKGDSILVYWPPLHTVPDSIRPVRITLSDRASISPAAGEEVPFSEETRYTVTAEDGTARTYTLHPHINQPEPIIELQPTIGYIGSHYTYAALRIQGEYIVPDVNETKVFLIDTLTREETLIPEECLKQLTYNYMYFAIPYGLGIEPGTYDVKVVTGPWTKMLGRHTLNPGMQKPDMVASYVVDQEGQPQAPGSEITISYSISGPSAQYLIGRYTRAILRDIYGKVVGEADIVGQTEDKLTFRLPEDIPLKTSIGIIILYNSGLDMEGHGASMAASPIAVRESKPMPALFQIVAP